MGATKQIFTIMRENDFNELTPDFRNRLLSIEVREANEWQEHQNDEVYRKLYKAQQNAKRELQNYLFNKRNNKK